ncbi:MAG: hypothetical protein HY876_01630, partial [Coriobacteriales bacterium]|nr:hypothetical protein [Coriobacteriales bacterium]
MKTRAIAIDNRALAVRCAIIAFMIVGFFAATGVAKAFAANFNPNYVLSDANLRDYDSMSAAQIQKFLEKQPGALDTLVTPDHNGRSKKASQIIYDACRAYKISPKVMLVMLQKEQSLLTRKSPDQRTLERAVGAGIPGGATNRYPGFGNQIWNGARLLDGYGEGKSTSYIPKWKRGMTWDGATAKVTPRNIATFKLFVYNPVIGATAPYGDLSSQQGSLRGNANFWNIYRRYFGDPTTTPKRSA